jgi:hypothetical protein
MAAKERSIGRARIFVYYYIKYSNEYMVVLEDNTPKNNTLRARMMVALVASEEAHH